MAATRIMSIHINKGKTARQCIGERLDYIMNPKKTDGGILVSTYACSPETAADEFMLFRQEYQQNTGRTQENEVIGYHVRQAFKPEEITPEVANEIGNELASRMTDNHFAYVVATHIDKHHIHNHIIICSTDLNGQHKYRDVKQSAKDLAQISDSLCREHSLSVIQNPQDKTITYDKWQGNQRRFTHRDELRMIIDTALRMQPDGFDALMQLLEDAGCRIKRGAHISIKPPEGERYIRLDTLGEEYKEATLRRSLTGDHVHIPKIPRGDFTGSQIKRLIDIEEKLRAGKGKGYQIWAERNNIDAKAQMIERASDRFAGRSERANSGTDRSEKFSESFYPGKAKPDEGDQPTAANDPGLQPDERGLHTVSGIRLVGEILSGATAGDRRSQKRPGGLLISRWKDTDAERTDSRVRRAEGTERKRSGSTRQAETKALRPEAHSV